MTEPRVLVIGRTGQLALSLVERARHRGVDIAVAGRPELDLSSADELRKAVTAARADTIINAAAYTAVDKAEDEPELAHQINAVAPGLLADAARDCGARLVHVSTDYVFDGTGEDAWTEEDATGPAGVYGRTKLAGEQAIRERLERHAIVRTAWVYSPFGSNFVKTMLTLAETRETVNVVSDQIGSPTSALDLAEGLLAAIASWRIDPKHGLGETYHLAGIGQTSWAGLAERVMGVSRDCGGGFAEVVPISTAEYPTAAARPRFSILNSAKFHSTFGYRCAPWEAAAEEVVKRLAGAVN